MKVAPSNQTLILASERGTRGASLGEDKDAAPAPSAANTLQRVTMVTALPDSTLVYLRADYAPRDLADIDVPDDVISIQSKVATLAKTPAQATADLDGKPDAAGSGISGNLGGANTALVASHSSFSDSLARVSGSSKDAFGNPHTSGHGGLTSLLRPEEQYAQTQRILAAPDSVQLDVHA